MFPPFRPDIPVCTETEPVKPSLACPDWMLIFPVELEELEPDLISMEPPTFCEDAPDIKETLPPVCAELCPAVRAMVPAVAVEAPIDRMRSPERVCDEPT